MGPMLFTGLACFGAAVAQGLIASRAERTTTFQVAATSSRGLAIILLAFVQGAAVLGVVIGILSIVYGAVPNPNDGLFAAAPAIVGAIIGWELILLRRRRVDPAVAPMGFAFIGGIATLGLVIAVLAAVINSRAHAPVNNAAFVILGALSGAAALGNGVTGGRSLAAIASADDQRVMAIRTAQITRSALFQGVSVIATVVAILLLTLTP